MTYVEARDLDPAGTYRLLVGSVVPRPIAWVTSGVPPKPTNLAPFSSFAWVSQYPALLGFTVNRRADTRKDTIVNIERDGQFVVNIADESLLGPLHASSQRHPSDVSEAKLLGLELAPSRVIGVPRLSAVRVSMECVYDRTIAFRPDGGEFVVGEVVAWHIADDVLADGRIDTGRLQPIGRLAGPRYTFVGDVIELPPVPGG